MKQAGEILLKKSNREKRSAGAQESRLLNADECDFERLRCGTVGEHNSRKIDRRLTLRKPERRKSQRLLCRRNPGRNSDALIQDRRLEVISRTCTQHYKSAPENLPEIARQLGVAHILEGSVQNSDDDRAAFQRREPRDCCLANHRARARNAGRRISVDRVFAAKIVTSGESQVRPAHYLHS